ncbi:hypothetical protein [Stenotrophomonas sp. YIM B06876]|uniref:hypothetical protein n=1 Tax=Stenotrophomonas sp. YIM B06876 TaxID=3060211 RepID=UPI002738B91D|nr:hypothetical protein [Stenotrophomonas sp. YIM B06876]
MRFLFSALAPRRSEHSHLTEALRSRRSPRRQSDMAKKIPQRRIVPAAQNRICAKLRGLFYAVDARWHATRADNWFRFDAQRPRLQPRCSYCDASIRSRPSGIASRIDVTVGIITRH